MRPYIHKVQYYETDRMGVTHHANYVRWMEEARIDFLNRIGFPYAAMEEAGIVSPVRSVSCVYLRSCTFDDEIEIAVSPLRMGGASLTLQYEMRNPRKDETVCTATSEHVFLDREDHILRLKRAMPDFWDALIALLPEKDPAAGGEE